MKIVITGGHATPALAVVEELKKNNTEIYWFGEREAILGKGVQTLEYQVIPKMGIAFYTINSTKFNKKNILKSFLTLWKLPLGFIQSLLLLLKLKPDALLSFGSYIAVPPALAAWILNIPIITHEQTTVPGLANKIVGIFAKKIAITFPDTGGFNKNKAVLTGNPTRAGFFKKLEKKENPSPNILITGGSRGAHIINETVSKILTNLLEKYEIYHQTGTMDYEETLRIRENLPLSLISKYHIVANYSPADFEKRLLTADLVISRAGANTVLEIANGQVPAILIPIPWSGRGEQVKNAKVLEYTGLAKVLDQESLTSRKLLACVDDIIANPPSPTAKKEAKKLIIPGAAGNLAQLVLKIRRK